MANDNFSDDINESLSNFGGNNKETDYSEKTIALKKCLEKCKPFDTFWLTVGLFDKDKPTIRESGNTLKVLRNSINTFDSYVDAIHPDYRSRFFASASAAYTIYNQYKEEIFVKDGVYNSLIPLKFGDKPNQYWWVKQMCLPYSFNESGIMCSHFNVYRLVTKYEGIIFYKPSIHVGTFSFDGEISTRLLEVSREKLLKDLFKKNKLTLSKIETILEFWKAYQELKDKDPQSKQFPSSAEIAQRLDKGVEAIRQDNRKILKAFDELFPSSKFTNIKDVITFLYNLFGRIED